MIDIWITQLYIAALNQINYINCLVKNKRKEFTWFHVHLIRSILLE